MKLFIIIIFLLIIIVLILFSNKNSNTISSSNFQETYESNSDQIKPILLVSLFITSNRAVNRYDRYDIFKYTLESYSRITFEDDMYFFIKFDTEYSSKKQDFEVFLKKTFPNNNCIIEYNRQETQEDWKPIMTKLKNKYGMDKLIFFEQCDDHVFIDKDTSVLVEGIKLLNKDNNKFKGLSISHWPEAIGTAIAGDYKIIGNYINYKYVHIGSNFIWNLGFLYFITIEHSWKGKNNKDKRLDSLPADNNFGTGDPYYKGEFEVSVYTPLREILRHFDGYGHVGIHLTEGPIPQIEIPMKEIDFSREELIKRITIEHTGHSRRHVSKIPDEIIQRMLKAYGY